MPSLIQVKQLSDLCVSRFNARILDFVNQYSWLEISPDGNIKGGPTVMGSFLENIHPIIVDRLLHDIEDNFRFTDSEKILILQMYKHNYMTRFNVKFKLPNVDGFYETYLKNLSKLVVLNLTKVCTDEILAVVGENCPLLKVIHIVSKTESISKNKMDLNALKLKFFVSDDGLQHLHNCKHLNKIHMDKIIRSCGGGRKITHNGLRSLLYALPNIQYISYEDMGLVLEGWEHNSGTLNLRHIHDNHITPKHINIYNSLCPSLHDLCLAIPTVELNPNMSQNCLNALSSSDLKLHSLMLKSFIFDYSLENYLNIKGEYLLSLSLDHDWSLTTQCLFTIGRTCKNLEHLTIKLLFPGHYDFEVIQSPDIFQCFKCLKSLQLFGINWKPRVIFPLCIHNAKGLESLTLFNKHHTEDVSEDFEILSSKNSLTNLQKFYLLDGFNCNHEILINFVWSCKSLREIMLKDFSFLAVILEFKALQENFDLTINYGF